MFASRQFLALCFLVWMPYCFGADYDKTNHHSGDHHGEPQHDGHHHDHGHHGGDHHDDFLSFSCNRQLSFGSMAANNGGTVIVAPIPFPPRLSTGSVTQLSSSAPMSARCTVTANPPHPGRIIMFSVSLPANGSVQLAGPGGTMAVSQIVGSSNNGSGQNPMSGNFISTSSGIFHVGATLHIGANQAPGSYSGTFSATLDWP